MTSSDGVSDYAYDARGQLTAATYDYQTGESYSYDANGNRTTSGYTTGDHNRLLSDGTYTYEYDPEGNRTKRTEIATGAVTEYEWDHRNRLVEVTDRTSDGGPIVQSVEYVYDSQNRWIAKSVDPDGPGPQQSTDTHFVYDGNQIVLQLDAAGTVTNRYLWGPAVDQILADEQIHPDGTSEVLWPLTEQQNIMQASGASVWLSGGDPTPTDPKPVRASSPEGSQQGGASAGPGAAPSAEFPPPRIPPRQPITGTYVPDPRPGQVNASLEKLRQYLYGHARTQQQKAEVDAIIEGLKAARQAISARGGPVLFKLRFGIPFTKWQVHGRGAHCTDCEFEVFKKWGGAEHFAYDTKTKLRGQDHVWGEISFEGEPIVTIDFWKDFINFWRPGENGFGWIPDEDVP